MTMKIKTLLAQAALSGALLLAAAGPALAQTYTKDQLQQTFMSYLSQEGYNPNVTQAGNVRFRREGKFYIIYVDEKDPEYFRLVLSFSAEDKSAQARLRRLEGANLATTETKVVKAYIDSDGDPNFACEMFLIVPGDFKTHLSRLLRWRSNRMWRQRRCSGTAQWSRGWQQRTRLISARSRGRESTGG